jgi:hypothetical protein
MRVTAADGNSRARRAGAIAASACSISGDRASERAGDRGGMGGAGGMARLSLSKRIMGLGCSTALSAALACIAAPTHRIVKSANKQEMESTETHRCVVLLHAKSLICESSGGNAFSVT